MSDGPTKPGPSCARATKVQPLRAGEDRAPVTYSQGAAAAPDVALPALAPGAALLATRSAGCHFGEAMKGAHLLLPTVSPSTVEAAAIWPHKGMNIHSNSPTTVTFSSLFACSLVDKLSPPLWQTTSPFTTPLLTFSFEEAEAPAAGSKPTFTYSKVTLTWAPSLPCF